MFTLCLDNAQTFTFRPAGDLTVVVRKAVHPRGGMQTTGQFEMATAEARAFWKGLLRDGAFRV